MLDLDDVRDEAVDLINARDREGSHVLMGVGLTVGFAIAAATIANLSIRPRRKGGEDQPITERPRGSLGLILPAMFSATTLSALRVWNAPARPACGAPPRSSTPSGSRSDLRAGGYRSPPPCHRPAWPPPSPTRPARWTVARARWPRP